MTTTTQTTVRRLEGRRSVVVAASVGGGFHAVDLLDLDERSQIHRINTVGTRTTMRVAARAMIPRSGASARPATSPRPSSRASTSPTSPVRRST